MVEHLPAGLSVSFDSLVALIFTPVAKLLLYGELYQLQASLLFRAHQTYSVVTGVTGYGPY